MNADTSDDDELLFGDSDDSGPPTNIEPNEGILVLVVDDDEYVHQLTNLVLKGFKFEGQQIELMDAYSGSEAKQRLKAHPHVAVVLLDVVMETDDSGLQVVNYIRNDLKNSTARILIRTGQPGAAPEETVFNDYDINDYLSKTDISANKLRMSLINALRSFRDIKRAAELQKQINLANQEQEAANAASKAKSQFLAHMSHEIRTPLNGIIGVADILSGTELTPQQQDYVDLIRSSGEALLAIINDILDFSKIEANKLELEQTPFHLKRLCEEVQAIFYAPIKNKSLDFSFNLDKQLPENIISDPVRIKQILINLIGNAIKFTQEEGKIELNVSLSTQSHPETNACFIHFAVKDSGIGITPEQQERLFQPFSQADPSTTRKFGGTGLGLQISKRLAELMGGDIELSSLPNQGSTFTVTIEALTSNGDASLKSPTEENTEYRTLPADIKVLVAEDNPTNQLVTRSLLKRIGYGHAEIVSNGKEAVNAVQENTYDIVLMDCQMPEMDGYEATRCIRKLFTKEKLPVLALSAGATQDEQKMCFDAGMDDFISKPVTLNALKLGMAKWH